MREVEHLLIGGGVASANAAQELAAKGAKSVLLVGRELDPPYERPPATKDYLRGESSKQDAYIDIPAPVEVMTRVSVTNLDTDSKVATLSNKEEVKYEHALLATGALIKRFPLEGAQLEGIHFIRTLPNSDDLRGDVEKKERVVIIGGSFIGVEVAASLTMLGKPVTIVMIESEPMANTFGERAGAWVRRLLEDHGIEVIGGAKLKALKGSEHVEAVELEDGKSIKAQAVVMGTGVIPDVTLAKKAGLQIGAFGGVVTDTKLKTSADDVYAAGDIAEFESVVHGGKMKRIEHFEVAAAQGRTAARNMLGEDETFDTVPYFWSDIADWATIEYVGAAAEWDEEKLAGSYEDNNFSVEYLNKGKLVAVMSVGGHADLDAAGERIKAG
jgi:3-phenylpropionate/trans-cinnamate dioxygenase ferredoxin reductase subunit